MPRKRESNQIQIDGKVAYVYFRGKDAGKFALIDSYNEDMIKKHL
ncbi:hypothetical protein SAMN04487897_102564 [Paenibacillus sp. yr247]|nr:hypothetical protein [Paenibacillus sp. yr247]SDN34008.1 hypothetical protein SAMN04487897_102564 [Paenibacillus sp. yr247]